MCSKPVATVFLKQAGFAAHLSKSIWKLTQYLSWYGIAIDMTLGQVEMPEHKTI